MYSNYKKGKHNPCIPNTIRRLNYIGYMEVYEARKDEVFAMDLPIYQIRKKKEGGRYYKQLVLLFCKLTLVSLSLAFL